MNFSSGNKTYHGSMIQWSDKYTLDLYFIYKVKEAYIE